MEQIDMERLDSKTKEVMEREDLYDIIKVVSAALDRQLAGKAKEQTKAATARAEQLRALSTLVGR
jgi:hypothetical protein